MGLAFGERLQTHPSFRGARGRSGRNGLAQHPIRVSDRRAFVPGRRDLPGDAGRISVSARQSNPGHPDPVPRGDPADQRGHLGRVHRTNSTRRCGPGQSSSWTGPKASAKEWKTGGNEGAIRAAGKAGLGAAGRTAHRGARRRARGRAAICLELAKPEGMIFAAALAADILPGAPRRLCLERSGLCDAAGTAGAGRTAADLVQARRDRTILSSAP